LQRQFLDAMLLISHLAKDFGCNLLQRRFVNRTRSEGLDVDVAVGKNSTS
jgi:hypothetical protein